MPPETAITAISTKDSTIFGRLVNKAPVPRLYKCPFNSIISPMYIKSVMAEAVTDGTSFSTALCFLRRNDPVKTPAVTPKRTKNSVINTADNGETRMLPSLQKAVKQASMQRPRNEKEQTD